MKSFLITLFLWMGAMCLTQPGFRERIDQFLVTVGFGFIWAGVKLILEHREDTPVANDEPVEVKKHPDPFSQKKKDPKQAMLDKERK